MIVHRAHSYMAQSGLYHSVSAFASIFLLFPGFYFSISRLTALPGVRKYSKHSFTGF